MWGGVLRIEGLWPRGRRAAITVHPTPCTPHPKPDTRNPQPDTLIPKPRRLPPFPSSPNPTALPGLVTRLLLGLVACSERLMLRYWSFIQHSTEAAHVALCWPRGCALSERSECGVCALAIARLDLACGCALMDVDGG